MKTTLLGLVTALITAITVTGTVTAQDSQWLRMWENAQKLKPARLTGVERIAPASEPGIPFTVRAQVLDAAGKPLPGVEVFAYQTDQHGIYAASGAADPWRLKGWAMTDGQGRFQFQTIRPAAYPSRDIPGHVHLTFTTGCCGRQVTEVMFDDDPLATKAYRERQAPGVMFGKVTKREDGSQEVNYTFTLKPRGDF
jgi:protocatechuate 3,4-dioxygenase beta subunit